MNTSVVGIAARLVTVVTIVMLDRVAAKQRSGIALVLSSPADINHQRAPPLRRFAASRSHVSIADRAYIYPFVVRVTLVRTIPALNVKCEIQATQFRTLNKQHLPRKPISVSLVTMTAWVAIFIIITKIKKAAQFNEFSMFYKLNLFKLAVSHSYHAERVRPA